MEGVADEMDLKVEEKELQVDESGELMSGQEQETSSGSMQREDSGRGTSQDDYWDMRHHSG